MTGKETYTVETVEHDGIEWPVVIHRLPVSGVEFWLWSANQKNKHS